MAWSITWLCVLFTVNGCRSLSETGSIPPRQEVYDLKAEIALERRIRQGDADASSLAKLAMIRLAAGDAADARNRALEGLGLNPEHPGCLLALARAQAKLRSEWEAVRTYRQLVDLSKSVSYTHLRAHET